MVNNHIDKLVDIKCININFSQNDHLTFFFTYTNVSFLIVKSIIKTTTYNESNLIYELNCINYCVVIVLYGL